MLLSLMELPGALMVPHGMPLASGVPRASVSTGEVLDAVTTAPWFRLTLIALSRASSSANATQSFNRPACEYYLAPPDPNYRLLRIFSRIGVLTFDQRRGLEPVQLLRVSEQQPRMEPTPRIPGPCA